MEDNKKKFVSWRRVSTQKQNCSGLGLLAQKDIIDFFVRVNNGNLIADYEECYTGKDLAGCTELNKAIAHCKSTGATLIIAKSDRFRNTAEALQIYEELGEGHIMFCDLPHTDKFTLTLFFALAEREALLVSIRTKAALKARKDRGEKPGGCNGVWGKKTGADKHREELLDRIRVTSAKVRRERAMLNESNLFFIKYVQTKYGKGAYKESIDFDALTEDLNLLGQKTPTGLEYTRSRTIATYDKFLKMGIEL